MSIEPLTAIDLGRPTMSRVGRLRAHATQLCRAQFANYLQVFAGTGARLAVSAVYFFILANTLSLHDMGIFAAASATGIMIGCFSGFGFSSFAFRAAAGRRSALGGYLAVFYVSWLASLPLCIGASLPVYFLLFEPSLPLWTFVVIIAVEAGAWRIVEMIHQVNNGLGRYAAGSLVIGIGSALRMVGTLVFAWSGDHSIETWSLIYFAVNVVATIAVVAAYQPRVRLRWRTSLFLGRLRDALMFSISYSTFISQNEVDKLVMLSLADERTAGIYAISTRIIDFTCVPIRTFYVLYSRKLIAEGRARSNLNRSIGVEAVIALISTVAFVGLLAVLSIWPDLLGRNIASAAQLFGVMLAVPAFKNLLEYHSELFFAYQQMTVRAALSTTLLVLKALAIAALLISFDTIAGWSNWLNAVYVGLYVISATVVYFTVFRRRPQ